MTKDSKPWLVRIPEVFDGVAEEVLQRMGAVLKKRLGQEYYLIDVPSADAVLDSDVTKFLLWNLPMEHTWPCDPRKMELFIEKAAQTLAKKFGDRKPQGIFIGQLNPGSPDRYYKSVASNLRGRALQLFEGLSASEVEAQDPGKETLFCLVGKGRALLRDAEPTIGERIISRGEQVYRPEFGGYGEPGGSEDCRGAALSLNVSRADEKGQPLGRAGSLPRRNDGGAAEAGATGDSDRPCAAGQTASAETGSEIYLSGSGDIRAAARNDL